MMQIYPCKVLQLPGGIPLLTGANDSSLDWGIDFPLDDLFS